jgi:hypothetical protein
MKSSQRLKTQADLHMLVLVWIMASAITVRKKSIASARIKFQEKKR